MPHELISHSPDLTRLREEGYFVEIYAGFLLLREVPYVNAQRQVQTGTLISSLTLAGDVTQYGGDHVVYFDGEFPCTADGMPIQQIGHQSGDLKLRDGLTAKHSFSSKPENGYTDYHHKMTTYAAILSSSAAVLKPGANPRTFRVPDEGQKSVFKYIDTASDRAGIGALSDRLAHETLGIIGLGGTGSYILDSVAKTPVREIRLFDGNRFLQHNAFRSPGAPSINELRDAPLKVDYWAGIYSKMHGGITPHAVTIDFNTLHLLEGLSFMFVCIDRGVAKRQIFQKLEALSIPFIDVGMGLELVDGSLGGILRTTASIPGEQTERPQRVDFEGGGEDDVYASNIQVADLNALNAVLAVIKWKKIRGFYRDLEGELHSTYTTDSNMLLGADFV